MGVVRIESEPRASVKVIIIIVVGAIVVIGGMVALGIKYSSKLVAAPPATKVRVELAATGPLVEIVSAPGEIQPRTKVSISAMVAAPIVALPCDEGTIISKGNKPDGSDASILVKLDDKNYRAALNSAQSRFDAAKAQIAVAQARIDASQAAIDALIRLARKKAAQTSSAN